MFLGFCYIYKIEPRELKLLKFYDDPLFEIKHHKVLRLSITYIAKILGTVYRFKIAFLDYDYNLIEDILHCLRRGNDKNHIYLLYNFKQQAICHLL